jgi:hypothetical protein
MARYNILTLVGETCITMEDGEKVYNLIHPELAAGRPVELDFSAVGVFASPFFNVAIGRLLNDLTPEDLNRLLTVSNLAPAGMDVLKLVVKNSAQYYGDPTFRQTLDDILREQAQA